VAGVVNVDRDVLRASTWQEEALSLRPHPHTGHETFIQRVHHGQWPRVPSGQEPKAHPDSISHASCSPAVSHVFSTSSSERSS